MAEEAKPVPKASRALVPAELRNNIYVLRDREVMLDQELAELYGVETGALTRAVRRNRDRFPDDFMFQLAREEWDELRSQIGISNEGGRGGRRYRPYVFSEQGVAMLSSVLRSKQAVAVNIEIMRAFVELRHMAQSHEALARRLNELERELKAELGGQDAKVNAILKLLGEVTISPPRKQRAGFAAPEEED